MNNLNNPAHFSGIKLFKNNFVKKAASISVLVIILLISLWLWAFLASRNNFDRGEDYYNKGEYIKAITYLDRSIHWYTPFNPYVKRSIKYLWEISNRAEMIDDDMLFVIALETIKDSLYSQRSFYSPGTFWIKRSEERIQDFYRDQDAEMIQDYHIDSKRSVYNQSIVYNDPNVLWTLVLEIGLWGWIGAVIGSIYFCLGAKNKDNKCLNSYLFWILLSMFCLGLFILGLIMA